jgi:CheY-like chemotaxis protein
MPAAESRFLRHSQDVMRKLKWDNITILVVDDNAFMRKLIVTTLYALGITSVVTKPDAKAAIGTLGLSRTNPIEAGVGTIDIILSDFVMPELDGSLFLRWIRTDKKAPDRFVPFVMVSGAADQAVVEAVRDAGVTEFLAKPFSAKSMSDRILEVIRNPRQFVLAPGYFGPDRRRQDRPVHWQAIRENGTFPDGDRRITTADQIQVIHTRSNTRKLRDDVRAIYFRPANKLRDKLGPNALRGLVDFDPLIIQAAEMRIQELVGDYSIWVGKYLDSMTESFHALSEGHDDPKPHFRNINHIAHELRGQGGVFDYPLITAFGKTLYEATTDAGAEVTQNRLKLIEAHIDALRLVFGKHIKGNGGEVGLALMKDIERAVQKYSEPKKPPTRVS